ncbi:ral guanine nucleotide dissociation stimulator-like isoform X9 [Equus przewalskii]|uniref:Ral guanine nucleotide dissociation stimulator-like isoform X9 n=1 Tax=Equus przewalskii TaxID=9798 RepID=A0ABM4PRT1_EQUPR
MTAQDRARVVELWIQVSKECQGLRNFPSLHAILSALQSCRIHRLKKTWGRVSRKSSQKFYKIVHQGPAGEQEAAHGGSDLFVGDPGDGSLDSPGEAAVAAAGH